MRDRRASARVLKPTRGRSQLCMPAPVRSKCRTRVERADDAVLVEAVAPVGAAEVRAPHAVDLVRGAPARRRRRREHRMVVATAAAGCVRGSIASLRRSASRRTAARAVRPCSDVHVVGQRDALSGVGRRRGSSRPPRPAAARQQRRVGVQHGFVALIRNRAEHLALGGVASASIAQRLIGCGRRRTRASKRSGSACLRVHDHAVVHAAAPDVTGQSSADAVRDDGATSLLDVARRAAAESRATAAGRRSTACRGWHEAHEEARRECRACAPGRPTRSRRPSAPGSSPTNSARVTVRARGSRPAHLAVVAVSSRRGASRLKRRMSRHHAQKRRPRAGCAAARTAPFSDVPLYSSPCARCAR